MSNHEEFDETIPSEHAAGREVQERIIGLMEKNNFSMKEVFGVRLALEEALVNAIKHGNRMDPNKSVHVSCRVCDTKVRIIIEDEGEGFDVNAVPDPTEEENLEKPGGRGIMLIRNFMNFVEYNDSGNRLTMEKQRESAEESSDD